MSVSVVVSRYLALDVLHYLALVNERWCMMPGYTITETLRELGIGIARLRKLMLACGIVPVDATNERGKVKVITAQQLEHLRDTLETTTLTASTPAKGPAAGPSIETTQDKTLAAQFDAIWSELHALRHMIEVSQVNFSSRGHLATRTDGQEVGRAFNRSIGIGKARVKWLAVAHGATSPYAAKDWACWNAETMASDATAIAAVKTWLDDPRHTSGTWTRCDDVACPCSTM